MYTIDLLARARLTTESLSMELLSFRAPLLWISYTCFLFSSFGFYLSRFTAIAPVPVRVGNAVDFHQHIRGTGYYCCRDPIRR